MIIESVLKEGRKSLAENEVKELLRESNIPTTNFQVVSNFEEIDQKKLKFPVVLKVCSPSILHKTDVGGVVLEIHKEDLELEFRKMREKFPNEKLLVESFQDGRVEVIVGLINDATFGLTVMFGIGGIYTEVYKDVTFRVVPIKREDAEEMLREIKAAPILEGFRKIKVDRDAIINILMKVSALGEKYMDKISYSGAHGTARLASNNARAGFFSSAWRREKASFRSAPVADPSTTANRYRSAKSRNPRFFKVRNGRRASLGGGVPHAGSGGPPRGGSFWSASVTEASGCEAGPFPARASSSAGSRNAAC